MAESQRMGQMLGDYSKAKPGDLLEFKRSVYTHWAVYIGDGRIIEVGGVETNSGAGSLHGSKEAKNACTVSENYLTDDLLYVRVNNELDEKIDPHPVDEIIRRAKSYVGQQWKYDLLTNNCEVFAKWCRYGQRLTHQAAHSNAFQDMMGNYHSMGLGRISLGPVQVKLPNYYDATIDNKDRSKGSAGVELLNADIGTPIGRINALAGLDLSFGVDKGAGKYGVNAGLDVIKGQVGPVHANYSLRADTGVTATDDSVGFQILGTGLQIGRETKISFLGSSIGFKF